MGLLQQLVPRGGFTATPGGVTALYAAIGTLWILLTDLAVDQLIADPGYATGAQTVKGWAYVAITAASLYFLMTHLVARARRADLAALAEERRFRDFAETASDWFWKTGPDLRFTYLARPTGGAFGLAEERIIGRRRDELMAPDIDPALRRRHLEDLEARRPFRDFVYPFLDANGRRRHARSSGKPVFDGSGSFRGYRGVAADVTADWERREALHRLAEIVEVSPNLTATARTDGTVVSLNPAGRAMLAIGPDDDLAAESLARWAAVAERGRIADEAVPAALRDGLWRGETVLGARDGRTIPVLCQLLCHRDSDGRPVHLSIIAVDMTEHRAAAAALREREAQYRAIFEASADGLLIHDGAGTLVETNRAGAALHGYAREEMIGRHGTDFIAAEHHATFMAPDHDRGFFVRGHHLRKDGTLFPVTAHGRSFMLNGAPHRLTVIRDETERAQMEAQLRQAQKMEALGQLTGGVAHDFNNLMTVVLVSAETLAERVANDAEAATLVDRVLQAGQRATDLTLRMLAVARKQTLRPEAVDTNAIVADLAALVSRTLGEAVMVETSLDAGLWPTWVDRGQLETSLLNLAINARDAMPDGGRLTMETANVRLDEGYTVSCLEVEPGDYVVLTVTDTGEGMTPDVLDRAFDPFFTTKEPGRGTGLGLSMLHGFVKQSGGHVSVYSEPDEGTTFRIYLPRHTGTVAEPPERQPEATASGRGETILAVEDDSMVRQVVSTLLADLGYDVLTAETGVEALERLAENPQIALLFTDVIMPGGMSGPELAAAARARRPGLRVLLTSGYGQHAAMHRVEMPAEMPVIGKPYTRAALAEAVRRALDGR